MQFLFHLWKYLKANFKHIVTGVLLLILMLLAFLFRIQGGETLPDGQFTENEAYLFYKQASIISEQGVLPARDMDRWVPYGRDNGQILTLYAYTIAYTHKILKRIFPKLTLYQVQLYTPAVCFTLGLGVLFLFLAHIYGRSFAFISSVLLATLPGSVERSAIGFGDRDAFCWMFGIFAVTGYLWKDQLTQGHKRRITTVLSGIAVLLGGLSWGGFGIFLFILMALELWKFCTTDIEQHLNEYILWIGIFVPWLYILSPIYRRGTGFATHVAVLMLFPPLVIFAIRGTRYLVLKYLKTCQKHSRKIAWGLTLLAIIAGASYCYSQFPVFETTAFAFRESSLMKSVGELEDPFFKYWTDRYGTVFVLGSIGLILACSHFGTRKGTFLGSALFLFIGTTFFRDLVNRWTGSDLCDMLFLISLALIAIAIVIASFRKAPPKNELVTLAMFAWFLLWMALARSGKRYDFFIGVPLAFGTASLLWLSPAFLTQTGTNPEKQLKQKIITISTAIAILIAILFLIPLGGHVTRLQRVDFKMRPAIPGEGPMTQALTWIQDTLPKKSVIATDWTHGIPLNVLGGVKTVTDSDHFLPHWIHLYYRHVFCAFSEKEALAFLKTHETTHLLLTEWDVTARAHTYSEIGSNNGDRQFEFYPLQRVETPIGTQYRMMPTHPETPFVFIDFDRTATDTLLLTIQSQNGNTKQTHIKNPTTLKMVDLGNGGLTLYFDKDTRLDYAYYIPPIGWNSLGIKLFLRGEYSKAFVPIYPVDGNINAKIKIWKIHYPPDIEIDDKYLVTKHKKKR